MAPRSGMRGLVDAQPEPLSADVHLEGADDGRDDSRPTPVVSGEPSSPGYPLPGAPADWMRTGARLPHRPTPAAMRRKRRPEECSIGGAFEAPAGVAHSVHAWAWDELAAARSMPPWGLSRMEMGLAGSWAWGLSTWRSGTALTRQFAVLSLVVIAAMRSE